MFYNCTSLKALPNIINFQVNNLPFNCSGIFAECSNLITIPDISNWFNHYEHEVLPILGNISFSPLYLYYLDFYEL